MSARGLTRARIAGWIPVRRGGSHKGDYGHVLIVAGSRGMTGAAVLAAQGALRSGAGLVTLAVPESREPIAARKGRPESMTLSLLETPSGTLSAQAVPALLGYIKRRKITSLAIGPGLSRNADTARFVRLLLRKAAGIPGLRAAVIDADAFLALVPEKGGTSLLAVMKLPAIVTPHPGEMAAFCGLRPAQVQKARARSARDFAKRHGVICVLKGQGTIISDGNRVFVNPTGNPGMAKGGCGDILTGLIAGLVPQIPGADALFKAACIGVYVHGLAGDLAARNLTQIAMAAGDVLERVPQAFKMTVRRHG